LDAQIACCAPIDRMYHVCSWLVFGKEKNLASKTGFPPK